MPFYVTILIEHGGEHPQRNIFLLGIDKIRIGGGYHVILCGIMPSYREVDISDGDSDRTGFDSLGGKGFILFSSISSALL